MAEYNYQPGLKSEPRREDFKNQIEFDLARINYWYENKGREDHPLWNVMQKMEANLRCKLGLNIIE